MNATIPNQAVEAARGWVFYDGECSLCLATVARFAPLLRRHQFDLAPLQTPWVQQRLGLNANEPLAEMKLLAADEQIYGGADALLQIAKKIWWAWPLFALAQIPGVTPLFHLLYRWVAANRTCVGNVCQMPRKNHFADYACLIALPTLALLARNVFPAWIFMWLLAFAIYFGCKWLTWRQAVRQMSNVKTTFSFGYLFGWIGMDARKFLEVKPITIALKPSDWLWATIKIIFGATLIWFVTRHFVATQPLLAGWIGMVGIILCLHFGLFQFLALAWQRIGVNAQPIMREPLRATSLADFWGRRWNGAFHFLANDFIFRRMLRKYDATTAILLVFLISGVIHDLIISLPAHGGYGLPTTYFLIQGLGVIFERTPFAKQIGLGQGWRGWLFVFICTVAPAFWLFHPPFIQNVILPMLHAIGAT